MATPPTPVRDLEHLRRKPHFVYEFYDLTGDAVYVGCTVNLADRLRTHQASEMWREVAEVRSTLHSDRDWAMSVEARLIRELQPRWNFQCTERASEAARERHRQRRESARAEG